MKIITKAVDTFLARGGSEYSIHGTDNLTMGLIIILASFGMSCFIGWLAYLTYIEISLLFLPFTLLPIALSIWTIHFIIWCIKDYRKPANPLWEAFFQDIDKESFLKELCIENTIRYIDKKTGKDVTDKYITDTERNMTQW